MPATPRFPETFARNSFFQNWFDCNMAFEQANDNTDAKAMRAWARSRKNDEAFREQTQAATRAADNASRFAMQMNNR